MAWTTVNGVSPSYVRCIKPRPEVPGTRAGQFGRVLAVRFSDKQALIKFRGKSGPVSMNMSDLELIEAEQVEGKLP